jgi:hypothetical protein
MLLQELLKKVSEIPATADYDAFGRIYEYFLGEFARTEGQKAGEFYTLRKRRPGLKTTCGPFLKAEGYDGIPVRPPGGRRRNYARCPRRTDSRWKTPARTRCRRSCCT